MAYLARYDQHLIVHLVTISGGGSVDTMESVESWSPGIGSPSKCPSDRGAGVRSRLLAVLFVASFAFDFKGAVGGSLAQFSMAGVNLVAFLLLMARYRAVLPRSGIAALFFWGWLVFLYTGSLGAWLGGVPLGHYIRTIYPFVLFIMGFLVAWWVSRSPQGADSLVSTMLWTAVVSLLFTVWWGFHSTGDSAETIRHQILSPVIPFLVAAAGYDLIFAQYRRARAILILALTLAIIGLSVTRSLLLVLSMLVVSVLAAAVWNWRYRVKSVPKPVVRLMVWGIAVGILGVALAGLIAPDVITRWVQRSVGAGHDVTFWTRIAAVVSQWEQLVAHPTAWFVGRGFGNSYHFAARYEPLVIAAMGKEAFYSAMWFPGEFMWITPLYYAGFLSGILGAFVLVMGAVQSFRTLAIGMHRRTWYSRTARPVWVGALAYLAFLGLSFTANPFVFRLAAMFLGLVLGLAAAGVGRTQCFPVRDTPRRQE